MYLKLIKDPFVDLLILGKKDRSLNSMARERILYSKQKLSAIKITVSGLRTLLIT